MSLENRVSKLERQNRFLKGAFALLAIVGITVAAASPEFGDTLTLKSPNGKNTITLKADDKISGIWIHRGVDKPMVALYNDYRQGAVVGVYGDHTNTTVKGMDACLNAGPNGPEGYVQASDRNGDINLKPLYKVVNGEPKPLPE